ncbi:MAG: DUF6489 family protein [Pseudomonadota bacterium]
MKITIDIECSPEEARSFLGMPNVAPLNEMIVSEMTRRAKDNLETLADPERMVQQWIQMGGKGMDALQGLMGAAMSSASSSTKKK